MEPLCLPGGGGVVYVHLSLAHVDSGVNVGRMYLNGLLSYVCIWK